ncbi:winged helix-turn-helix domain-containing protein [Luteimonas sp. MC1895]|uniref:winged helix-turn-helix domain-containing protein n=1 Tax=Luteimonas sp. MC1895 TaxID=2819513 RepID=UPI0018F0EB50|nr:winged helix-turn-helix domain-containing protein [Luteimonas sp. MC1895]MBJ6977982.1 winged helix-turn-helix domain-containing protein [Luteimonas sp. MC1895]
MPDEARIYRFGDIEVDTAAHRVLRMGRELALEPKAYGVLLALLARHGHAITRDELLDQVWGHRHVTPGVLNRVVAQLRKALGDEAEHPRYIQTVHAVGYRFIAVPEVLAVEDPATEISAPPQSGGIFRWARRATDVAARRPPARRTWLRHLAVVLAIVLALAWWQRPEDAPADGAAIALRPFTALGGAEDEAWFAEGLAVEMHDALASVPGLRVAALMASTDPRRDADVRELGRELGVDAILDASIRREGDRVRINARLSDTATGYVLWSRGYEHSMAEVFATQGAIAGEVVESMLGSMPEARESLRTRLAPTRNVAAFDAYLRGRHLQRATRGRVQQLQAAEAFRAALAEDADFALAQAALCATEARRFEYWNDSEAHARARSACARVEDMRPLPPEAALALGNLGRIDGRLDEAERYFRLAGTAPGSGALAEVGLGKVEAARGRQDRAQAHFRAALARAPDDALVHAEVGFQAYRDGRLEDAIARYRRAVELAPGHAGHWNTYGFLQLLAGHPDEATRAFKRSIAIEPGADVLANFATLRAQAGAHAEAVALYRRALELDPDDHLNWGRLGDGLAASGAPPAEVADAYREAQRRARQYLALDPGNGGAMAALGWYSANLGRRDEALALVARARAAGRGDPADVALHNAATLALLGDRDGADRELTRARDAGMAEVRIRARPGPR